MTPVEINIIYDPAANVWVASNADLQLMLDDNRLDRLMERAKSEVSEIAELKFTIADTMGRCHTISLADDPWYLFRLGVDQMSADFMFDRAQPTIADIDRAEF